MERITKTEDRLIINGIPHSKEAKEKMSAAKKRKTSNRRIKQKKKYDTKTERNEVVIKNIVFLTGRRIYNRKPIFLINCPKNIETIRPHLGMRDHEDFNPLILHRLEDI